MSAPLAAISWSGGKDCTLALLMAREQGFRVCSFLTKVEPDAALRLHALPDALLAEQVRMAGGVWRPLEAPPGAYAAVFEAALQSLRAAGHTHMIFGDIDLQAHRDWIEPICVRTGIVAVFPLWGMPRTVVSAEILRRGIRARVVCVDAQKLDASFCGADYDDSFLARLPAAVCPCGEDGEFHTFVLAAPGFTQPLAATNAGQRPGRTLAGTETVLQILTLDKTSP